MTADYFCLLVLVERKNCCTLVLGKDVSVDNEGCRKSRLRVYFGICLILKAVTRTSYLISMHVTFLCLLSAL